MRVTGAARKNHPPLEVAKLDSAVTAFRVNASQAEKAKPNGVAAGDLLVSADGERCRGAFERRRMMIRYSLSTNNRSELLFWRPPEDFVDPVASEYSSGSAAAVGGDGVTSAETAMARAIAHVQNANASNTSDRLNPNSNPLVRQLQGGGAKTDRGMKRILQQLGLMWQG